LVEAQNQGIVIFCFFHGGEHNVVTLNLYKRVLGGQRALVLVALHGERRVIQLVSSTDTLCLTPTPAMRIQRISKVMMTFVGMRIGPRRRAQQRQPKHVSFCVIPILAIVQQAESVLAIGDVCPAQGRNLKLGLLGGGAARGGPLDGPVETVEIGFLLMSAT